MGLIRELQRRNVIRMAGLYVVGAWLLVQVASTVLPAFDMPDWALRGVIIVLVLGFVPMLVFAWVFELTPEGLKRDADVPPEQSIAPQTARRLEHATVVVLLLAVVYFAFDKFVLVPRQEATMSAASRKEAVVPPAAAEPSAISDKSIAVLAFSDLSPNRDQEYFSDGMAEEILDALAQVRDLKVAGRTSSFYFKGKNETLQTIGKALGVAHVLEGSVRKQGDRVRITVQLIQTRDGFHLWSESYDGDLQDVFALQEKIARSITDQLEPLLLGEQKSRLSQAGTKNADAYQQYLRGRFLWNKRGLANLQAAVAAFEAAIAADPDYADAWAGLAQSYALITEYSVFDPGGKGQLIDRVPQALDAAGHALKLDPDSSRALSARAYVRCLYQFDWAGAEADYRAAIARDPNDAGIRQWYGELLFYQRRWKDADEQYAEAVRLDPLVAIIHFSSGLSFWFRGDDEAAGRAMDEALRLAPEFATGRYIDVLLIAGQRRFDQAETVARALPENEHEVIELWIGGMRDPARADAAAAQVVAHGPGGIVGKPLMLALLGKHDLVLSELERLFAQRDPYRAFIYSIGVFDPLHHDPRFQALLRQINLPQPPAAPSGAKP